MQVLLGLIYCMRLRLIISYAYGRRIGDLESTNGSNLSRSSVQFLTLLSLRLTLANSLRGLAGDNYSIPLVK